MRDARTVVVGFILMGAVLPVFGEDSLNTTIGDKAVSIRAGDAVLLNYRYGGVPFKPYVKELFTPAGVNVLLDAPHDHLHHHALMLALGIDGIDFWGETPGCGHQKHSEFKKLKGAAGFVESLYWADPKSGKVLVDEKRTILACLVDEGKATLVTWQSVFAVGEGVEKVSFDGRHYFGLGMRFVRAMDGGRFFNADKAEAVVYRGDENLVRSRWCAYTAKVDGKTVTVAMFDAAKNARHPATWFTMKKPFAYMAGTLALYKETLELKEGDRLNLRYGVAVWDGEVSSERIEAVYREWIKRKD